MSSPEQWTYYKPVRRIRQACQNCRRKKVRCPGQKPECSFCARLGQPCTYSDDQVPSWAQSVSASNQRHKIQDKHQEEANQRKRKESDQDQAVHEEQEDVKEPAQQLAAMRQQLAELTNEFKVLQSTVANFTAQVTKVVSSTAVSSVSVPTSNDGPSMDLETTASSLQYSRLPPMHIIRSAADLYFRFCHNQPYSLFHEASLRHKIESNEVPAHLLFALVASTIRYSEDSFFEDKAAALTVYSHQSWRAIVMPWNGLQSEAELSIVQTILLLAIIDYTEGRTQASWIKVGLAIRLCQDFRLMVEPDSSLPPVHREERRRVFWSFYLCDKLISCGRERPATILDNHCRLQLPCDENAWRVGADAHTPTLEQLETEPGSIEMSQLSPFAVTVLVTSLLGRCAQYALGEQEGPGVTTGSPTNTSHSTKLPPWNPQSKYSALHSAILQHESELGLGELLSSHISRYCSDADGAIDQHSAAPVAFAHALFYLCQCLLYHPLLLRQRLARIGQRTPQSFLAQTFNSCHNAASSLSRLMGDVRSLRSDVLTTSYDPFYGYCNIVAGAIHVVFLDSPSQTVRDTATAAYEASLDNLESLSMYWRSCAMMRSRLQDLRASATGSYTTLIDPAAQDVNLSADLTSDLLESLDYARMSTTPRSRRPQSATPAATYYWPGGSLNGSNGAGGAATYPVNSGGDLAGYSQLPSPFFEELINLLPFATASRPMTPRRFDPNLDDRGAEESSNSKAMLFDMARMTSGEEKFDMNASPLMDSGTNMMGLE